MARISGSGTLIYAGVRWTLRNYWTFLAFSLSLPWAFHPTGRPYQGAPSPQTCLTFDKDSQKENSRKCEAEQLQNEGDVTMAQVLCRRESGSFITTVSPTHSTHRRQHPPPGDTASVSLDPLCLWSSPHFPGIQDSFLTQPFHNNPVFIFLLPRTQDSKTRVISLESQNSSPPSLRNVPVCPSSGPGVQPSDLTTLGFQPSSPPGPRSPETCILSFQDPGGQTFPEYSSIPPDPTTSGCKSPDFHP